MLDRSRRGPMGAFVSALPALLALLAAPGCQSHGEKIAPFRQAWEAGDFPQAEVEIDALIASEAKVDPAVVTDSKGCDEAIDIDAGDTCVLMLEKGMVNLVSGNPDAAVTVWRRCRDKLDERFCTDAGKVLTAGFKAAILDDTALPYTGADYEHIVVRVMLAIADLLSAGGDAYAYALQVGEKQEEIVGSSFGEEQGYKPRESYRRVAIGAYLQGLMQEADLAAGEAHLIYERALEYAGASAVLEAAVARTEGVGTSSAEGTGVVHVFYLGGRGPRLVEGTSPTTDAALALATWGALALGDVGPLGQAPVPVPVCEPQDLSVPALSITLDGMTLGTTEVLLDVNQVAREQLEAGMPLVIARAVIRRALKAGGSKVIADQADDQLGGFGELIRIFLNLFLTSIENADTRNWSSLPAQFQVARLEVPKGERELDLGPGFGAQRVLVDPVRDTFVVAIQPNLAGPGVVLVDPYSRVQEPAELDARSQEPGMDSAGEPRSEFAGADAN